VREEEPDRMKASAAEAHEVLTAIFNFPRENSEGSGREPAGRAESGLRERGDGSPLIGPDPIRHKRESLPSMNY